MSVSNHNPKTFLDRISVYLWPNKPVLDKTTQAASGDKHYGLEFQTFGSVYGHPVMEPDDRAQREAEMNAVFAEAENYVWHAVPSRSMEGNLVDDDQVKEYIAMRRRNLPYERYYLPDAWKHGTSIYHIDEKVGGAQRNPRQIP